MRWVALAMSVTMAMAASSLRAEEETKTETVRIGPVNYQVPASWQRQLPRSEMRIAQFGVPLVKGDEGKIEFIVFYFQGGGGSVDDNVKRWVGFFDKIDGKEVRDEFESDGMKISTLDVSGSYKDKPAPFAENFVLRENYRMLAAVVETPNDGPYFFRLVGPRDSITAQLENWNQFFRTAKQAK